MPFDASRPYLILLEYTRLTQMFLKVLYSNHFVRRSKYGLWAILCYGKRFHIQISAKEIYLHGNLQLETEYPER
jgi:hypothetical protein